MLKVHEQTGCGLSAIKKLEWQPQQLKSHVNFMKHTLGKVTERKRDHYGKTSRHDKKDR